MDQSKSQVSEAEAAELAGYFAKFSAALTQLDEELARWKNYEEDYTALKTTLLDLPKETSHPVMVPIGNLAFMPGKLIHTNEVLVMLGDNWFVDRSAVQAAEIVDRRMELVQENIIKLQAQQEQIQTKREMAPGILGGQEYNEEGLPIVEITEPYFSDEEETDEKSKQSAILPFSQKTPKEQAEDRAILDRIAELEREDEERERRREAGEIVTSDEDTDSDDEPVNYDDEESEDDFRPGPLDSDEEYEEEVWEHSDDNDEEENDDDDDDDEVIEVDGLTGKKSVRFADQVPKTKKSKSKEPASAPISTSTKPKSPSDLINLMRAKQGSKPSTPGEQIVTMDNLESTFASMATSGETKSTSTKEVEKPVPAPLKSALKPPPKKVSLFKQLRAESEVMKSVKAAPVAAIREVVESKTIQEVQGAQEVPKKKMSKFAMERAAATGAKPKSETPVEKSAVKGFSELVFEKNVVQPSVVNTPSNVSEAGNSILGSRTHVGAKDVIENTFTKPPSVESTPKVSEAPQSGREKPSLFRQQQQTMSSYLEPEPAVPEAHITEVNQETDIYKQVKPVPPVVAAKSVKSLGSISEKVNTPTPVKDTKGVSPGIRMLPVAASSKLKDSAMMKGSVVEHEDIEPVDEDELEDDMLMRQVVSEYQERRQAMIAKHGAFDREGIERLWEQQVVIPPGMIIPEDQYLAINNQHDEDESEDEDEDEDEDEENQDDKVVVSENMGVVDDRNLPPKKLSLFRAARLSGTLAKNNQ
ncbi:uri1, prefoldin-like chaperone [Entomortierella beljakovae]|nr:uri1, prefoldin-like chaperone [Entomortierella beljakovae]